MFRKISLVLGTAIAAMAVAGSSYGQMRPPAVFDYLAGRAQRMADALPAVPDTLGQADRNSVPAVGDCPDFRGGFAERKWDCPLHARQRGAAELGILFSSACLGLPTRESMKAAVTKK